MEGMGQASWEPAVAAGPSQFAVLNSAVPAGRTNPSARRVIARSDQNVVPNPSSQHERGIESFGAGLAKLNPCSPCRTQSPRHLRVDRVIGLSPTESVTRRGMPTASYGLVAICATFSRLH